MAQRDLINAFDDCIDRLNAGETLASCLRSYPHLVAELQPMLEVSQAVRGIQVNPLEIQLAQSRSRARLTEALQAPATPRPPVRDRSPLTRLATLAALFVLVMSALLGGASITAQDDLPGDALYGLKRLTEAVRLNLSAEPTTLQAEFAQRRINEISALLAIPRSAPVEFSGEIHVMGLDAWLVAGLPLQVPPGTPGAADRRVGDVVHVIAHITDAGSLIADHISLLDEGPEPTPTPTTTAAPSQTPALSATPSVTLTPWSTPTPMLSVTPTVTPAPSMTPAPVLSPTATTCVATQPDGWVSYQIRSGDTLSLLATSTGITLEELMQVNCLTDPRLIVVGQQLFLPFVPVRSTRPEINDNNDNGGSSGSSSSGSSSSGGSSNDNGNDNDDDGGNDNDNSNDDDDDGGSSNSGSGSSNSGSGSSDDDDD